MKEDIKDRYHRYSHLSSSIIMHDCDKNNDTTCAKLAWGFLIFHLPWSKARNSERTYTHINNSTTTMQGCTILQMFKLTKFNSETRIRTASLPPTDSTDWQRPITLQQRIIIKIRQSSPSERRQYCHEQHTTAKRGRATPIGTAIKKKQSQLAHWNRKSEENTTNNKNDKEKKAKLARR